MNSIILCEGRTDAILLSYYLEKMYGWNYSKKPSKGYNKINTTDNQEVNWYRKDDDYLLIYGVGGKDNFKNVIDEYVSKILQNYPQEYSFNNLIIIADKDDNNISDIEKLHQSWLCDYTNTVVNGEWQENFFKDKFDNQQSIRTLSIIIPTDKQGALETTLLDAISENTYNKVIVDMCSIFVQDIRQFAKNYIKTDRLVLKAHLSSVFAILSPEKVFTPLDTILKQVPWEQSKKLYDCFCKLNEL